MNDSDRLISHDNRSDRSHEHIIEASKVRLRAGGDMPGATLEQQLEMARGHGDRNGNQFTFATAKHGSGGGTLPDAHKSSSIRRSRPKKQKP